MRQTHKGYRVSRRKVILAALGALVGSTVARVRSAMGLELPGGEDAMRVVPVTSDRALVHDLWLNLPEGDKLAVRLAHLLASQYVVADGSHAMTAADWLEVFDPVPWQVLRGIRGMMAWGDEDTPRPGLRLAIAAIDTQAPSERIRVSAMPDGSFEVVFVQDGRHAAV